MIFTDAKIHFFVHLPILINPLHTQLVMHNRTCHFWTLLFIFPFLFCPILLQAQITYNHAIGHYPGNPKENFAPVLRLDSSYRNIAEHRMAFHSSCSDYNHTAQLVTDGIITTDLPKLLEISTIHDTVFPKRTREYVFDGQPYSCATIYGEDTYLQFHLQNWQIQPDEIQLISSIAHAESKPNRPYKIHVLASQDGKQWDTLFREQKHQLIYKKPTLTLPKDCSWSDDSQGLIVTDYSVNLKLDCQQPYSYFRLHIEMEGAAYWRFGEVQFLSNGQPIDMYTHQFFTSAWTSETSQNEWVYVDLGKIATFDSVCLHWVNKATKGYLQVSNDAEKWQNIAPLSNENKLCEPIRCQSSGRFVRVLMLESGNEEPFVLSELEIWGKGGLTPHSVEQPEPSGQRILLSGGNWKLTRCENTLPNGETLSLPHYDDRNWIPATVPGTVLSSYINIGAVPDPNYADNTDYISDSYFHSNFWYRNIFVIPQNFKDNRIILNFDGINWKANIFLNGHNIGRIEGAFQRAHFDITPYLVMDTNVLVVEIIRNEHFGSAKEKNELNTDFNGGLLGADNPTFHASAGWDWITTVRGRNMGIWNDVYICTANDVIIEDPVVYTSLNLPDTAATLTPEIIVKNLSDKTVTGLLTFKMDHIVVEEVVTLSAHEVRMVQLSSKEHPALQNQHLQLWWPNGYGKPFLHAAQFSFITEGVTLAEQTFQVGVRQMTYNEDDGILRMFVNGRRFIGRGGNWGFSEHNLNYRAREYNTAVAYHADMNFTMIRNWVGMIGDEEFFEACDRYGIMVWQDFWLANPSDGPNPTDETMFLSNAKDWIYRLRKHPSIALYCGRNEGFPPENLDNALRKLIQDQHSDIHYISSSADDVVSGHGPYRALDPVDYFRQPVGNDRMHTERGMPCVMNIESLRRTLPEEALWPQNVQWGKHDYTLEGAQHAQTFNELIDREYGFPDNVEDFCKLAQRVNHDGYRALFESRSIQREGLLLWMSHPCWPSMVWQTYDYYFEPTAAYFGCKKANKPIHVQWNPSTNKVEVVNYSAGQRDHLKVWAQLINPDGKIVWQKQTSINCKEDATIACFSLKPTKKVDSTYFIKLYLSENDIVIDDNFYINSLTPYHYKMLNNMPKATLDTKFTCSKDDNGNWTGILDIENNSDTPALFIRLNLLGQRDHIQILPVIYEDNYFSLLPKEKKQVTIQWLEADTRGEKAVVEISH